MEQVAPPPGPAAGSQPWRSKCPWGSPPSTVTPCSLSDVMSEELAKELQQQEESAAFPHVIGIDTTALIGEGTETSSDLLLAQMLQMQFDREYDAQLRREENKFNGGSKVSISFENYRMVHPFEDSESSDDEVDWQDTRHDPYGPDKPSTNAKRGFVGKGREITTKHDEVTCGRRNTARMENFAPEFQVGDGIGMDLKLSNRVFNALKQHSYSEQRRSARIHEKKEHSTSDQAVDSKTRLLLYKMVNAGVLESVSGCISTGKESVIFHAKGGRMQEAGIPCPEVVMLKKHVLVMSFIGQDHVPAPKLKDVKLSSEDMKRAYYQVLYMMQQLYTGCKLVHADLSAYNMLWHMGKVWLIDVSQSVEPTHPHGLEFLFRDCKNVSQFFQKAGVVDAMGERELFNAVSGLDITADNEVDFIVQIEALEKINEDHVQQIGKRARMIHECEIPAED
ncbi:serine/threonine-protein kinase RIO3 isoform X2 [Carcharodon carcharias]|uniref:serine/threonine-protein kinase RIO3 isoform X2 n=1 Tax=Carcharodon carcharias TaxID=13397 RepID=UPI001B7ED66C|nr:serine/threonine-protein kinase RIO3 isoform X2 [Carcharodon carcharias]